MMGQLHILQWAQQHNCPRDDSEDDSEEDSEEESEQESEVGSENASPVGM